MENKMVKVILDASHGVFEPKPDFEALIKAKGYPHLFTIEARIDKDLVEFVEKNASEHEVLQGKDYWTYVSVVEVDTSRLWLIDSYDGAEGIKYMDLEVIDEKLNLVRLKR